MVFRDDELGVADVFDLHAATILTNFSARPDRNHDLRPGVKDMDVRAMSGFVSRENPNLEPPEAALRHRDCNPCGFG
jgi:hypothetical protein